MKLIYTRVFLVMCIIVFCTGQAFAQPNADFSANHTTGCSPLLVQFTDISSGSPTTWSWDFGDGNNSTLQNPSHTYAAPGQYTVVLTASNGSGANSETKTNYITVFNGPTADFTATPDTVCSGNAVSFVSTSTQGDIGISQYTWSFNDGSSDTTTTSSTFSHVYSNSGSSPLPIGAILSIVDSNGCVSTNTVPLLVLPSVTASFNVVQNASCTIPDTIFFNNTTLNTSTFSWTFGDPSSGALNTSTLQSPSHIYNTAGTYIVSLTAGTGTCTSTLTDTLFLQPPNADFTTSDTDVCIREVVQFTNASAPFGAPVSWNFGDPASGSNNSSILPNPTHTFLNPGTYTVTMTVIAGACIDTKTQTIYVHDLPHPSMGTTTPTVGCFVPFTVSFTDSNPQIASWSWNFGDPASGASNISTLQNPSHVYNNFGIYTVVLTETNIYGCTDSITQNQYIQIIQPTVNIQVQDSGCVGTTFPFTAVVTANDAVTSYDWNFGDGTGVFTTTTNSTTHQFNTVGIYDVSVTIHTTTGCTATVTKAGFIRVGTQPAANFSASPLIICFQENVQFTDLTPAPVTGWLWSFGDGGSSTEQNPNHQYQLDTSGTADPFDVTLIAFYNGCPDTLQQQDLITVLSPLPAFTIQYNCASPFSVSFVNNSGGATSYQWDFGDSSPIETIDNPTHVYATTGTFNVTLTATSTVTSCVIDTILPVTVTNPSATMVLDTNRACHTAVIQTLGSSSQDVANLTWTFGEGIANVLDTSYTADTLHIYNRPGDYLITLTVTDIHGCIKVDTETVHILGPTAGFSATPTFGCTPVDVNFTDTSLTQGAPIDTWIWNYGVGTGDTTCTTPPGSVSHSYNTPGSYNITLTVIDTNNCSSTHTSPSFIRPSQPNASISTSDTTGCLNILQGIFGSAGAGAAIPITYEWTYGDGSAVTTNTTNSTNDPTSHTYSANGVYPLHLVVTDANGCKDSTDQNIVIFTTPATFSMDTTLTCQTQGGVQAAQLHAEFTVANSQYMPTNYDWDITFLHNTNWTSPVFQYTYPNTPGTYPVTLIVTNQFGCTDTSYASVIVPGQSGTMSVTPITGCRPLTVQFTGSTSGSSTFLWDFADGSTDSTSLTVSHIYTQVGTLTPKFYAGIQVSGDICYIPMDSATVTVTSPVTADIDSAQLTCIKDGDLVEVHVNVNDPGGNAPYTYTWYPSGIAQNSTTPGSFLLTANGHSGFYTVEVSYGLLGCSAADTVIVDYCPCIDNLDSIPNAFTPGTLDGLNDYYHVDNLCDYDKFRIIIFNRWGKKIYESSDINFHWNGLTDGGAEASDGTYYYIMDTRSGEKHGWIELIRKEK